MNAVQEGAPAGAIAAPVAQALALAAARMGDAVGGSGEPYLDHARGTIAILRDSLADEPTQVAAALTAAGEAISGAEIEQRFGHDVAVLVASMRQILKLRELTRASDVGEGQVETLRRLLLALAADIRVVILRLASRLQTLRWCARQGVKPDPALCRESLHMLAPLANRLGLWQLKWEIEDLSLRFLEPETYARVTAELEQDRGERERSVALALDRLRAALEAGGVAASISGRSKHLYSIVAKMRAKGLALSQLRDLRALRVIVDDLKACYAALAVVHEQWPAIAEEFDDYIARPKPNGYQSLHTVVVADDGKPLEVQIRTREMDQHAEYGIASHWRYKERISNRGDASIDERIAWARQLLSWQREVGASLAAGAGVKAIDEGRIYVLTPLARVIDLPAGSTPIDFAYHLHSGLGHRVRGARVDGQMVPLNTALANGQTVEVIAARPGGPNDGPSRDWLNPELGYVRSPRARTKVRQYFNALAAQADTATGRERVEKVMQREGRTALAFEELARRLHQPSIDALFLAVARDEIGPRLLEEAVRGPLPEAGAQPKHFDPVLPTPRLPARATGRSGVLVVGVDSLMTQLARCCRPAPPDPIVGFVTRGRGVSVHRQGCRSFESMARAAPERVIETDWGVPDGKTGRAFPVDVLVRAADRPGLLRDVSDVFARDRLNVIAVQTLSKAGQASMSFTVEVPDTGQLARTLATMTEVSGVFHAERK